MDFEKLKARVEARVAKAAAAAKEFQVGTVYVGCRNLGMKCSMGD